MMTRTLPIALLLAALSTSAWPHAFLDEATPKVGAVVKMPPGEIRLEFTQGIEPAFSHIELAGENGELQPAGKEAGDPKDPQALLLPLKNALKPGHYEVRWAVVSVDTHRTNGHFTFDYQP